MQIFQVEQVRINKKGKLLQISTGDWKQCNYLQVNRGQIFGGHYHKIKKEFFYVIKGKIRLQIQLNEGIVSSFTDFKAGDCFLVEPFEKHTLIGLKRTLLVELLSEPYSKEDTYE